MESNLPIWSVDKWTIFPHENRILNSETEILVKPRLMRLWACLLQRQQKIVPKDTLIDTVWPDRIISDSLLAKTVSELRRFLEEHFEGNLYIETIRAVGYRLKSKQAILPNTTANKTPEKHKPSLKKSAYKKYIAPLVFALTLVFLMFLYNKSNAFNVQEETSKENSKELLIPVR